MAEKYYNEKNFHRYIPENIPEGFSFVSNYTKKAKKSPLLNLIEYLVRKNPEEMMLLPTPNTKNSVSLVVTEKGRKIYDSHIGQIEVAANNSI